MVFRKLYTRDTNLKKGETFATGMVRPRTTALFFDRLWVPYILSKKIMYDAFPYLYVPRVICVRNPWGVIDYIEAIIDNIISTNPFFELSREVIKDEFELGRFLLEVKNEIRNMYSNEPSFPYEEASISKTKYRYDRESQLPDKMNILLNTATTVNRNRVIKELVTEYKKEGIHLTPIYLIPTKYDEIKIVEEQEGVEICLDFIPDVVEEKLTWEQVLEFRKDKKAKMKLDCLRRWFKASLLKKSEEEIKNILGQKLDDYQWALKKHGIQTVIGGSTSIMSFVSGPTLLKLLTESPLAMVSGGVAIGAGAIAWIGKKVIERTEIKRDPIAYIYEVRKLEK